LPKATVRANARTLPEAERPPLPAQTAEELQALASDFEAAFQAHRPFFYGSGTHEEAAAVTARVDEIARKIVALPTTDIEMMRLKARIYLCQKARTSKPSLIRTTVTARPRRSWSACSEISAQTTAIPFLRSSPSYARPGIGWVRSSRKRRSVRVHSLMKVQGVLARCAIFNLTDRVSGS
jgi:hypothetical protein